METLNDLVLTMHNDRTEINAALNRVQGWRGLLDPFSAEWHDFELPQKAGVLRMLMQYRTFTEIIDLYLRTEKREYITQDLPCAIFKLMEHLPEAQQFFYHDKRCTESPYYQTLLWKMNRESTS